MRLDSGDVSGNRCTAPAWAAAASARARSTSTATASITLPETKVAVLPLSQPGTVDYGYDYVSYSVGVNYRIAEPVSVFGRYSRGGRAAGERQLFGAHAVQLDHGPAGRPRHGLRPGRTGRGRRQVP
jgi:outer membrane receptor protein involved in Fe transport